MIDILRTVILFCICCIGFGATVISDEFYKRWRNVSTIAEAYALLNKTYDPTWNKRMMSPEGGLIINPKQKSKDTCKLEVTCTALNIEQDPTHLYFPYCIDLQQCTGTCCSYGYKCEPTKKEIVKVRVTDFLVVGTKETQQKDLIVEVEKHVGGCKCKFPEHHDDASHTDAHSPISRKWFFW